MSNLRARVSNGRLVMDEPTELPDGTVLDLVIDDEGDDLDEEERKALDAAILRGLDAAQEGRLRSADDLMADLRARR